MKKHTICLFAIAASPLTFTSPLVAAKTFTESLQQDGVVKINFRTRFEDVTEANLEDSDALTTRSRISYTSGAWNGIGFSAEFDDVTELDGDVDYRSFPGDTANPGTAIIADPEGTEVNQAFVSYTTLNNQFKYGRQRLILDNARFVGNVGWRQNEQTYDSFSFTNKTLRNTNVTYAYIWNVNRVFGDNNTVQPDHHMDTHIINVNFTGFDAGKLIGYAYLLENETAAALSSDTLGLRWQSATDRTFAYNLEYAQQSKAGVAEAFDADYLLAEAVLNVSPFNFTLGYELLGSDDGAYGFATPLATLHAFQGWADRFLTTPVTGLEDKYFKIGLNALGAQFMLGYNKFDSDEGSIDCGSEFDVSVNKKIASVLLTAKYADYSSGDLAAAIDVKKFWVMVEWGF